MPSRPPPTRPPVLPGEIPAWLRVPGAGAGDKDADARGSRRDAPPPNRMVIPPVRTVPAGATPGRPPPPPRPPPRPVAQAVSRSTLVEPALAPQAASRDPTAPDAAAPPRRRKRRRRAGGGRADPATPSGPAATDAAPSPSAETLARGLDPATLADDATAPPERRRRRRRNRKRRQDVPAPESQGAPRAPGRPAMPRPTPRPPEPVRAPTNPDDLAFRLLMHGVRPHVPAARVATTPGADGRPAPIPHMRRADDAAVIAELLADMDTADALGLDNGETVSWKHPSLPEDTFRQLKRGGFRLEAELDLHGHNRDTARLAVAEFLARARERGWTTVRVIHGRGNGSPNTGPVLKRLLDGWLRRRADVLAFCTARPMDGGDGASYVLLRRARL